MAIDLEKGLELRLGFVQDQRLHYSLHTRIYQEAREGEKLLGREENELHAGLMQRVLRVEDDGTAHLVAVTVPVGEDLLKSPAAGQMRSVIYQHLDRRGEILEISGPNPGSTYSFPREPVSVGASWKGISKGYAPGRPDPVLTPYTYRLVGVERRGDHDCVQIEVESDVIEFESPMPNGQVTKVDIQTTGRMFFAPDAGILVRLELKSLTTPKVQGFTFETHNTVTQELLKVE